MKALTRRRLDQNLRINARKRFNERQLEWGRLHGISADNPSLPSLYTDFLETESYDEDGDDEGLQPQDHHVAEIVRYERTLRTTHDFAAEALKHPLAPKSWFERLLYILNRK